MLLLSGNANGQQPANVQVPNQQLADLCCLLTFDRDWTGQGPWQDQTEDQVHEPGADLQSASQRHCGMLPLPNCFATHVSNVYIAGRATWLLSFWANQNAAKLRGYAMDAYA